MRTDSPWEIEDSGQYLKTTGLNGYDVLINGLNRYLNFNTLSGSLGYGFRDNSGTMQFKNSGGSWADIGSGGGSQTPWTSNINGGYYSLSNVYKLSSFRALFGEATDDGSTPVQVYSSQEFTTVSDDFMSSFDSLNWTAPMGSFQFQAAGVHPAGLRASTVFSPTYPGNIAVMYYNGSWNSNQTASIVLSSICTDEDYDSIGPAVNVQTDGAFYGFYVTHTTGNAYIFYQYGSTQTVLANVSGVITNPGDTITLTSNNGTLTAYLNGTQIAQVSDNTLTGGSIGIQALLFIWGRVIHQILVQLVSLEEIYQQVLTFQI